LMAASWISSAQKGQGFIGPLGYAEASPAAMRVERYDGKVGLANSARCTPETRVFATFSRRFTARSPTNL
jgi:hypothetical protein